MTISRTDRPRPKRRHIPLAVKRAVLLRQGGRCSGGYCHGRSLWLGKVVSMGQYPCHFDHEPALRLRNINRAGTDYDPPQHSPAHLDALCLACHHIKTHGSGATTAGTDIGKIKKERKRGRPPKPKRAWPKGKKLQGRKFHKRKP